MAHATNGDAANASGLPTVKSNACRRGNVGRKVHMRMVDEGDNPRRPGGTGGWNKHCGTENDDYRHAELFVAEGRKCKDRFAREHYCLLFICFLAASAFTQIGDGVHIARSSRCPLQDRKRHFYDAHHNVAGATSVVLDPALSKWTMLPG
jgi:hypothetical protein